MSAGLTNTALETGAETPLERVAQAAGKGKSRASETSRWPLLWNLNWWTELSGLMSVNPLVPTETASRYAVEWFLSWVVPRASHVIVVVVAEGLCLLVVGLDRWAS